MKYLGKITLNDVKGPAVDHLNIIRGAAALTVVIHHIRQQFFQDFDTLSHPSLFETVFYFFTAFGQEAVRVFFVLSGFFIGLSVFKAVKNNTWSWKLYLTSRLTRLLLVLYPALLLGAIWDKLGISLFGSMAYGTKAASFTLENALGNAVFLQRIIVEPFGSNDPLWSLSYEFWYYILFPLGLLAMLSKKPVLHRLLYGFLFLCISFFVGPEILSSFLVWLAGAAVAIIPKYKVFTNSKLWLNLGLIISASALIAFLSISRAKRMGLGFNIMAILTAVAMAALIYFILYFGSNKYPSGKSLYSRASQMLAGCSYSLYLIHSPAIFFLSILIYTKTGQKWLPETGTLILSFFILLVILCYALLIAHYTEANTNKVRRWIETKIFKTQKRIVVNRVEIGDLESEKI